MENSYLYTLAFLMNNDQILMLNRVKAPWFGMWNGVGGKREKDESPLACIQREIQEETGIEVTLDQIHFRGTLTWNTDFKAQSKGLYLYFVTLPADFVYSTPRTTPEGILEWKKVDWIVDERNLGVAYNIRNFLIPLIHETQPYHYECTFEGTRLVEVRQSRLEL